MAILWGPPERASWPKCCSVWNPWGGSSACRSCASATACQRRRLSNAFKGAQPFMKVQDSTFLVSGGSSGLGAACVHLLATEGARVLIADVNRPAGEILAKD